MKPLFWGIVIAALALGIFIQETGGDVTSLPSAVQPAARRVAKACCAAAQQTRAVISPMAKRLGFAHKPASSAAAAKKEAPVRLAAKPVPPIVIEYRDDKDLLGQLKCVPAGQRLTFNRIVPGAPRRRPQAHCESGRCPNTETREQREMRQKIKTELARICERPQ